ncbi:tRNA glutamyl-Q(34) synthetase GluQRS [Marinobacter sp. SS21]|uniref:tRNA glutamyl-Q(34) synthetase GluQRS n=1 Tax=Marinobacter sp. SS21 TaxID=2979460 RepID=UPI00232AAFA8|nr:tRNA glutamyl-Q(34) synthetase GluQRS [Marinobacter sp. SS21]MDC0664010.1 tRNA glutamyl-Q(34) synthetase GluQRS [Marinobacter sp. SS21]
MPPLAYRGRFAPSPTGPLHFGSLVTALASYLEARQHQGTWLVRIEDLDPLRESSTATDQILASLEAHQLRPDEPVRFQSQRSEAYQSAIDQLLSRGHAYGCACSRKELRALGGHHTAACHERRLAHPTPGQAIRFALNDDIAHWDDQLLGPQTLAVRAEVDDPVILRKEGFFAYQLAVVLDDIDQGISHIVRGSDLLDTTGQQQQIFRSFSATYPRWLHIPVILNEQGQKLSKQTHAPALNNDHAGLNLFRALKALGQQPPAHLSQGEPGRVLDWACTHWRRERVPLRPQRENDPPEH